MSSTVIAEGLVSTGDRPALIGARCEGCGAFVFPVPTGCPRCSSERLAAVELARRGELWTWTSQEFRPKSPPYTGPDDDRTFQRYYVGYVELPDQLRVEARLVGYDEREPRIGETVELVVVPFTTDADGNEVRTFAFAPVTEVGHG
jgi:uncharacterized OB-fold protein